MAPTRWSACAAAAAWAPAPSSNASELRAGRVRRRSPIRWRFAFVAALAIALVVAPAACGDDAAEPGNAEVVRVVDGDTLVADVEGSEERVRLIGIDTPESVDPRRPVECFGKEASRFLADLLPEGTRLEVVLDAEPRDRYGRLLAYIYRAEDDLFVNLELVEEGYAQILTYPPNVAHAEEFLAAQGQARDAGRGLWSGCPHE